jgi:hypothetical protein
MTRGSEQPKILKSILEYKHTRIVSPAKKLVGLRCRAAWSRALNVACLIGSQCTPQSKYLGQDRQPNAQNQADVSQKPLQSLQRGNLYQNSNSIGA